MPTFAITDTKLYVPIVTLWTQDNAELRKQLESAFIKTINWNKYYSKITTQTQNQNLDFSDDPSFERVNRFFILSYEEIRQVYIEQVTSDIFFQP